MGREGKGKKGRERQGRAKGEGGRGREETPNILLHSPVPVF